MTVGFETLPSTQPESWEADPRRKRQKAAKRLAETSVSLGNLLSDMKEADDMARRYYSTYMDQFPPSTEEDEAADKVEPSAGVASNAEDYSKVDTTSSTVERQVA